MRRNLRSGGRWSFGPSKSCDGGRPARGRERARFWPLAPGPRPEWRCSESLILRAFAPIVGLVAPAPRPPRRSFRDESFLRAPARNGATSGHYPGTILVVRLFRSWRYSTTGGGSSQLRTSLVGLVSLLTGKITGKSHEFAPSGPRLTQL